MNVGMNLFSLRDYIRDESSLLSTALRLKEMGYTSLQYSGARFESGTIARVSRQSGMPFTLTHVPMDRILNEPETLSEEHLRFGCRRIGLGMMPISILLDEKKCAETVGALQKAAERMKQCGCQLYYHNHHFEFYQRNGRTVFDDLLENAPDLQFTVDVYWLQYGGVNPVGYFDRLRGRAGCVHLKDYRIVAEGSQLKPSFAPVGDGMLEIPAIIRKARENGAEEFYVEQDDACQYPDPWEQVARSVRYLKNIS